jgi:hypothetical protein
MKVDWIAKRGLEVLGLMMIGEGVMGMVFPRRYSLFWKIGPAWMRNTVVWLAEHPEMTRALCAAEIAGGVALAVHTLEEA